MANPARKIAFVLAASEHGTLIVNRFDYFAVNANQTIGVGHQILDASAYDPQEVAMALALLDLRRRYFGDGVVALDCGANIGVHTIEWAKKMTGWGSVLAIEAQERLYYALTGNIAINNCFNARALHAAVAAANGTMAMPRPDYLTPASFGSLELKRRNNTEFIGQRVDYAPENSMTVPTIGLDSLRLTRVDLIKLDVEGMEMEALAGAQAIIAKYHPILIVETIKLYRAKLVAWLSGFDYVVVEIGMNALAVHRSDQSLEHVNAGTPKPA
jgi:FkbM family methyltransferase